MNNLYQQTNYMADVDYLISTYIREYDISKANINILYKYGVINKQQYDTFLLNCKTADTEKIDKEIEELLKLFEYDVFDIYFEKYLRIDAERGEI